MNDIIAAQRIKHRRFPSLLSKAADYRAGSVSIAKIKQKPVHIRRRRKFHLPKIKLPKMTLPALKGGAWTRQRIKLRKLRYSGRTFVISVSSLAALTGLLLILLVVSWHSGTALYPGEDMVFRASLASYAGLSPAAAEQEGAIPLDLMETFAWKSYTVRRGDSVSRIAANHALSMDAIIASNGITNAKRLKEGEVIRIPNMDGIPYSVKRGDTLLKISSVQGIPLEVILDANDIQSDTINPGTVLFLPGARMRSEDLKMALGEFFIYPIRGRLTSPFGWRRDPFTGERRYHAAIDLAANTGTPIKAAMDGRVSIVGVNSVYGKYIILTHSSGYQTMYAHMNATSVRQGAYVNQGAKIGEVGSTGYSTGPHLHFAVYKNGRALNPLEFLNL
ncbi:MAG: M23 family metallopeptidase [Treponema sp.]|jgi:murein DD-endopeptidase MepM/ murein hydrolase activator NlpD|nr:M23 family metallopeptidase [Treponema sp.]